MASFNKVLLMGNLTRDPELRYTPKGTAVAETGLAVNRTWNNEAGQKQEETLFMDIVFWGRQAETAQQYLTKGRPVFIEGRLTMDTWDDKQTGQKRTKHRVTVENFQFLTQRQDSGSAANAGEESMRRAVRPTTASRQQPATQSSEEPPLSDDDIPF